MWTAPTPPSSSRTSGATHLIMSAPSAQALGRGVITNRSMPLVSEVEL